MAYVNIVQISCTDKTEAFCRMRDFICKRNGTYDYSVTGLGWTLWDSSYAVDEDNPAINDWFVIKSAGESTDEDLYFQIKWTNGYLVIFGFQAWNPTAHTGGNQYNTVTYTHTITEALIPLLWVYGDLDAIFICTKAAADTEVRFSLFGKSLKPWDYLDDQVANCSSTLTAGNDVSITVDSVPAGWAVDREVYIRTIHTDATATVKIEKITIKTLVGNVITADLTNSYTADSKLSDHVGYFCNSSASAIGTTKILIDPNGTVSSIATSVSYDAAVTGAYNDPGSYEDRWGMAEAGLSSSTGYFGKIKNIYRIAIGTLSLFDVLDELDGTQWRYIKVYSNLHYVFKEV